MKSFYLSALTCLLLVGCGGGDQSAPSSQSSSQSAATSSGFTAFELQHGIGPVKTEVVLGSPNQELADKGKAIFESKCAACHKLDSRYVGPQLGGILERRSPTYVMNMILNPQEMAQRHPEGKKLLAEFLTVMPFQNVSQDDATALVEYLRSAK